MATDGDPNKTYEMKNVRINSWFAKHEDENKPRMVMLTQRIQDLTTHIILPWGSAC